MARYRTFSSSRKFYQTMPVQKDGISRAPLSPRPRGKLRVEQGQMATFFITWQADTHNIYTGVWYTPEKHPWAKVELQSVLSFHPPCKLQNKVLMGTKSQEEGQRGEEVLFLLILPCLWTQDKHLSSPAVLAFSGGGNYRIGQNQGESRWHR